MDRRWRDGIGPSGTSLNHPKFKQYRWLRDTSRWEVAVLPLLVAIHPLTVYVTGSLILAVGIFFVGASVYFVSRFLVQRWSRNSPEVKRRWWLQRVNRWDTAAFFLLLASLPGAIYLTHSLAWSLSVAIAGPVLYLVSAALIYRRKRFVGSLQHEHDRLAAENARLKARLRRMEHSE